MVRLVTGGSGFIGRQLLRELAKRDGTTYVLEGATAAVEKDGAKVEIDGAAVMTVAEGNGPVNALDSALRQALMPAFPELEFIRLTDYKVRILSPQDGTKAVTRVMIETADPSGNRIRLVIAD